MNQENNRGNKQYQKLRIRQDKYNCHTSNQDNQEKKKEDKLPVLLMETIVYLSYRHQKYTKATLSTTLYVLEFIACGMKKLKDAD